MPGGCGQSGTQAMGLVVSGEGCWEIIGEASAFRLTFVTRVVRGK